MKILAFGASSSKTPLIKKLATYAASLFENGEVEILKRIPDASIQCGY
jgi:hypothetical protein